MWWAVASPVVVGLVAMHDLADVALLHPAGELAILRSPGSMPSIGESAPPSTW